MADWLHSLWYLYRLFHYGISMVKSLAEEILVVEMAISTLIIWRASLLVAILGIWFLELYYRYSSSLPLL
jgi:uncharacterized membrane protein